MKFRHTKYPLLLTQRLYHRPANIQLINSNYLWISMGNTRLQRSSLPENKTVADIGEEKIISLAKNYFPPNSKNNNRIICGIGDDTAVLQPAPNNFYELEEIPARINPLSLVCIIETPLSKSGPPYVWFHSTTPFKSVFTNHISASPAP